MRYKPFVYLVVITLLSIISSPVRADEGKKPPSVEELVCDLGDQTCPEGLSYHCTRVAYDVAGPDDRPSGRLAWSRSCGCSGGVDMRHVWPLADRAKYCYREKGEKWEWRKWASRNRVPILSVWTWIKEMDQIPERLPTRSDLQAE